MAEARMYNTFQPIYTFFAKRAVIILIVFIYYTIRKCNQIKILFHRKFVQL